MSLRDWLRENRLRRHTTSAQEVTELLRIVDRDLVDASIAQLSTDRRFATAYNACLTLATIALYAAGYRSVGPGHHWVTFQALPETMGAQAKERVYYLDTCRTKRNLTDYDRAGVISDAEADELLQEARRFRQDILSWLGEHHPRLLSQ